MRSAVCSRPDAGSQRGVKKPANRPAGGGGASQDFQGGLWGSPGLLLQRAGEHGQDNGQAMDLQSRWGRIICIKVSNWSPFCIAATSREQHGPFLDNRKAAGGRFKICRAAGLFGNTPTTRNTQGPFPLQGQALGGKGPAWLHLAKGSINRLLTSTSPTYLPRDTSFSCFLSPIFFQLLPCSRFLALQRVDAGLPFWFKSQAPP